MRWVKAVIIEIFRLFVDDGSYAISILVWLAIVWLLLSRLGIPAAAKGPIFFVGLAVIFVESATRRARK